MNQKLHIEASWNMDVLSESANRASLSDRVDSIHDAIEGLYGPALYNFDVNVSLVEPEVELPTEPGTRIVHSIQSGAHPGYFLTDGGNWVSLYSGDTLNREKVLSGLRSGRFVIGGPVR